MSRKQLFAGCSLAPDRIRQFAKTFHDALAVRHGWARREARNGHAGLLAWAQRLLPDHFALPPSSMHRFLAAHLDKMAEVPGSKLNLLAPRGSAKSTIATLAFSLRMALEGRHPYLWIVSDTRHQAQTHLENIKAELVGNTLLAQAYPDAAGRGPVWRSGTIELRNGVRIEAFGTGQRIRGRRRGPHRPTLILCDDLQNDDHIRSSLRRESSREWFFGTLLNAGTTRTNVVNLATALHQDALALQLARRPGWFSAVFKSVQRWPENMSLWSQWEAIYTDPSNGRYREDARAFYDEHREAMDAGAQVLWPEHEDLYALMCLRTESGHTAFEREKQNSPLNPELCEWPEDYFDETIWFDDWPAGLVARTMALDPSKGRDDRRGDYSALVLLGVDREGVLYVEADLARRPTPQIVAEGVELFRRFGPDVLGIEANQFQDLLAGEFESEFRRQGILTGRPVPIENRVNKRVRIRRLGPYLSGHRLKFKNGSPGTRLLVEQLKTFPVGDHDDGPDALEMAVRLAAELLRSRTLRDPLGDRLPVG